MKRPLVFFGVAFLAFTAIRMAVGGPGPEQQLRQSAALLERAASRDGTVTVAGAVQECSAVSEGIRLRINQISIIQKDNSEQSLESSQNIIFTVQDHHIAAEKQQREQYTAEQTEAVLPGDTVTVRGEVCLFQPAGNPGQFDPETYYYGQDTVCRLLRAEITAAEPGRRGVRALLWQLRSALRVSYEQILGEGEARTAAAISLGEKAWMDAEVRARYQESGIAHIVSVSGLHTSLIGMGVYRLLRHCIAGIGGAAAGSAVVLALYVMLTGSGVSAVRALLMFLIWLLAQVTGRKYDGRTAAAAAAILMVANEPRALRDVSFVLSFTAIVTISFLPSENGAQSGRRQGQKTAVAAGARRFRKALAASAGIWLGMLPVTLYYFYQTPPWSIFLNVFVVPLMPAVMGFGLMGALAGLVSEPLGSFLAAPVHYLLVFFDILCDAELRLPGAVQIMGRPSALAIVLYYGILALVVIAVPQAAAAGRIRQRACKETGRLLCVTLCLLLMCRTGSRELEITCLDVGQGDGALLRMPDGAVCMIDGGSSTERDVWNDRISPAVKYYGIDTIDYVLLSHADRDHTSGVEAFLSGYETGYFGKNKHGITLKHLVLPPTADPEAFQKLCQLAGEKGIAVSRMEKGSFLSAKRKGRVPSGQGRAAESGWRISCLAPEKGTLSGEKNEDSMVLLLQYGSFRMLFTGDLEGRAERELASAQTEKNNGVSGTGTESLRADVLKVGHHGSGNSSSDAFLVQVQPVASVISCAAKNRYGHPAQDTLLRLQRAGSRIYTTAEAGAVQIRTDGTTIQIKQFLE